MDSVTYKTHFATKTMVLPLFNHTLQHQQAREAQSLPYTSLKNSIFFRTKLHEQTHSAVKSPQPQQPLHEQPSLANSADPIGKNATQTFGGKKDPDKIYTSWKDSHHRHRKKHTPVVGTDSTGTNKAHQRTMPAKELDGML